MTRSTSPHAPTGKSRPELTVSFATTPAQLEQAQRLRAACFSEEFGLTFSDGLDHDQYDAVCDHVLVYHDDLLVATTRLMDRTTADKVGSFYTQHEFDLDVLLSDYADNIVEIGRSCVHVDYRGMAAINSLWQGIGEFITRVQAKALIGCASIGIDTGNTQVWLDELGAEKKVSVGVKNALPEQHSTEKPNIPPLLKAYVRMGSLVGDTACYDPDFKCADVLIWFPLAQMDERYLSRFAKDLTLTR